jgi:transposase
MRAYSVDLRERVIGSLENGHKQTWVARELGIGLGTVKRYIKLKQTSGSLEPKSQQREQPLIRAADLPALQEQVDTQPDSTLEQHIEAWATSHGVRVSPATMCRALQRLDRPLKKNAPGPRA